MSVRAETQISVSLAVAAILGIDIRFFSTLHISHLSLANLGSGGYGDVRGLNLRAMECCLGRKFGTRNPQ